MGRRGSVSWVGGAPTPPAVLWVGGAPTPPPWYTSHPSWVPQDPLGSHACDDGQEGAARRQRLQEVRPGRGALQAPWASGKRSTRSFGRTRATRTVPGCASPSNTASNCAPFFIVKDDKGVKVYTSAVELMREKLTPAKNGASATPPAAAQGDEVTEEEVDELNRRFERSEPWEMIDWLLARYGERATLAFSGAEDVALIEMAAHTKKPFTRDDPRHRAAPSRDLPLPRQGARALRDRDPSHDARSRRARRSRAKEGIFQLLRGRPRRVLRRSARSSRSVARSATFARG